MKYEVYLDAIFLIQFVMNYCVLMLTAAIMKLITSRLRIILATLINSLACCWVFLPMGMSGSVKCFAVCIIMILAVSRIAFCVHGIRQYLYVWCFMISATFLLGGITQWIMAVFGTGITYWLWLVLIIVIYNIVQFLLRNYRKQKSFFFPVTITLDDGEQNNKKISLVALWDTGNRLREDNTGKAVCIIDESVASDMMCGNYCVAYHTLGNEGSVLKAQIVPEMIIHTKEGDIRRKDVMLAFYPGKISPKGAYHMILHGEYMKKEEW